GGIQRHTGGCVLRWTEGRREIRGLGRRRRTEGAADAGELVRPHAGAGAARGGRDSRRAYRSETGRSRRVPALRVPRHLPHRRSRGGGGGRMTEIPFTPAQRAAIDAGGPPRDTCVVAGPGSGKTTVLVEHFRQLVEAGTSPQRILAITFTEKAAAHMRAKLAEACPDRRAGLDRAWVSTVHGFCSRLVRENAVLAGVDPEFTVADASESLPLQQECVARAVEELF